MPRIIAGTARGLQLKSPDGRQTRPTTDRIKESLFNIIAFELQGSKVIDFFAGTGSLGLEALSRGAEFAVFCENSTETLRSLKYNIGFTGFADKSKIYPTDAVRAAPLIRKDFGSDEAFGHIFMDPPYSKGLVEIMLAQVLILGLLAPGGTIVIETGADESIDAAKAGFALKDKRVYGHTAIWFLGNIML